MKTHRDLIIWRKSIDFVTKIYQLTSKFPKDENYGLSSQLRRAAVSIPSNIAEGAARHSKKEFRNFLSIALGSAAELETQLLIALNLEYIIPSEFDNFLNELIQIRKMIHGLINNIEKKLITDYSLLFTDY
ncbi:MAG TPA: four helix bundle protein [Ignavibacteriales bacterium]|nr:four helix bundle protein [Ignavibacteriales bacterium]